MEWCHVIQSSWPMTYIDCFIRHTEVAISSKKANSYLGKFETKQSSAKLREDCMYINPQVPKIRQL